MTLIDFPSKDVRIEPAQRLDEVAAGWPIHGSDGLGTPYGFNSNAVEQNVNDLARYKDASPAAISLAKAISLIDGDRDKMHGNRKENFGTIAALWSIYLGTEVKPHQVAWMMVLVKAARESNGTHSLDNAIDAAGYAALAGELAEANNEDEGR
jgi:hypothetical protein